MTWGEVSIIITCIICIPSTSGGRSLIRLHGHTGSLGRLQASIVRPEVSRHNLADLTARLPHRVVVVIKLGLRVTEIYRCLDSAMSLHSCCGCKITYRNMITR